MNYRDEAAYLDRQDGFPDEPPDPEWSWWAEWLDNLERRGDPVAVGEIPQSQHERYRVEHDEENRR